ncbi:MAG: hypothetical protein AAGN82_10650 [Myxococcota bacterium]
MTRGRDPAPARRGARLVRCALCFGAAGLALAACNLVAGIEEATPVDPGSGCTADAGCDDRNPCTEDTCNEDGRCDFTAIDGPALEQFPGDCQQTTCVGGTVTDVPDDTDLPDDGLPCTVGGCSGGRPTSTALPTGTGCLDGGVCDAGGTCVECVDDTGCDAPFTCGGGGVPGACGCTPVACSEVGLTCGFAGEDGCGAPLPCDNDVEDGSETDVDCGGPPATCATRCNAGRACSAPSDCASGVCTAGVCS